ncbi:MAG: hypothetical protein JWP29_2841 [Rhodoferax sp.]|nr:hypothetical protein [Rhodoferax sp.]
MPARRTVYKFRLYVADDAVNSAQARSNLRSICRDKLPGCHEVEVVDVFLHPERALADGVFLTPTLVKLAPLPQQVIVGTLSQTEIVLQALGLEGDM